MKHLRVSWVIVVGALSLLALGAQRSAAKCDPPGADAADVAAARAAVEANCDCAGARNHGAFVSCATQLTARLRDVGLLTNTERSAIQRCVAHAR